MFKIQKHALAAINTHKKNLTPHLKDIGPNCFKLAILYILHYKPNSIFEILFDSNECVCNMKSYDMTHMGNQTPGGSKGEG